VTQHHKLKGVAFEITDLLASQDWAERHQLRMAIRLDHGVDDEEYEEVIAFNSEAGACLLLMWREADAVIAQPMPGRQRRFSSVSAALSCLKVKPTVAVAS
jgi:hypothetical protein